MLPVESWAVITFLINEIRLFLKSVFDAVTRSHPTRSGPYEAGWQSGHAADCKSVNAGSIPTSASIIQQ
jgi:hypothetical protein